MNEKLIIDCDNTFSVAGCDIDDGLAIIYALAQENVDLLGITTTYGNNDLQIVYENTKDFIRNINCPNIKVLSASESEEDSNEAAQFLVEKANKYPGQLNILATGSMTNLYEAWKVDQDFYKKLKNISLMGGITETLIINDKILKELNFSCNHLAAYKVLKKAENLIIATGNSCLDGFFTIDRFEKLKTGNQFEKWLYAEALYWFEREKSVFNNEGIYLWDILAAVALLNKDFVELKEVLITPTKESLRTGLLLAGGQELKVSIPKISNYDKYIDHVYQAFKNYNNVFTVSKEN